jgi:hypothetical protein
MRRDVKNGAEGGETPEFLGNGASRQRFVSSR